jgi:segregation and condensation protein B
MEIRPPFLNLTRLEQKAALEAILFAAEEPLSLKYLFDLLIANNVEIVDIENPTDDEQTDTNQISMNQEIMNKFDISPEYFQELISELNLELIDINRPYQIVNYAGGYQFATRPEYGELIQRLTRSRPKRKFSQASLETLSIIAYKQPVSKPEIEQIRGVNSNEIVNSLLDKKLIKIAGRKDVLGKPLLYATTNNFLKIFGLKSLEDLPKLREIEDISTDDFRHNREIEVTLDVSEEIDAEDLQSRIDADFKLIPESDADFEISTDDIDKIMDSEFQDEDDFQQTYINDNQFDDDESETMNELPPLDLQVSELKEYNDTTDFTISKRELERLKDD